MAKAATSRRRKGGMRRAARLPKSDALSPRAARALYAKVEALEADLARVKDVNRAFRRVGMAVGMTVEIDELLDLILDTTREVLGAERTTLFLLQGDELVSRMKEGDEVEEIRMALGQGIAGHVAKTGRALRVADAYDDPRFDRSWDKRTGFVTRSILTVPVRGYNGRRMGVLQALNKRGPKGSPQAFSRLDADLLKALATQAAVALDKSDLFLNLMHKAELLGSTTKRLERSLADLELLYQLETAMGRAQDLPSLAREVISQTAHLCDAQAGALLFESLTAELKLYVVNLDNPTAVREVAVQRGEGVAGRAMTSGDLIRCDGGGAPVSDPQRVVESLGIAVSSSIAAPLSVDGERMSGALALYNHRGRRGRFSDEDGQLLRLVSANVSTALHLMQVRHERERSERLSAIGGLLSGVMHDLRTPLTVISGYVQLMQVADDAAQRAEYGETIQEQFEHIGVMQSELLAYARGQTKVLLRKVYIVKFCEELARQFAPELARADVTLDLDLAYRGTAFFDEGKIERAMQNLIRNALEAVETGGRIVVRAEKKRSALRLVVEDDGPGVPRAIRKRIFEPFVTAGKPTGTGLGLSNVREIAQQHSGTVRLKSSAKGSTFTLELPDAASPRSRNRRGA